MEQKQFYDVAAQLTTKLHEPIEDQTALEQWKTQMIELVEQLVPLKMSAVKNIETDGKSLDPKDWNVARHLAHDVLDISLDTIQYRRQNPVWQPIPAEVRSVLNHEPCPEKSRPLAEVFNDVSNYILPYTRGNTHPRFWGWVMGEGTLAGILGELMAATMNINAGGCTHSAVLVERRIIHWIREWFGFPNSDHGGIIVSGTSMATMICLATARRHRLVDVRQNGIVNGPTLIVYVSTEFHMCIAKALEMMGFGSKSLHLIPVDDRFRMNTVALQKAIEEDRAKGLIPFCVVGNAGTVNTGAFDDLIEISKIARTENLWFHVDGAFGALVILDPERKYLVAGIENADSLAFDFHKWLHCPYDAGCVLIRDGNDLISTFSVHQSYLANAERGCAGDKPWFCDLGIELSRGFRALKVWCTLKEHGIIRFGEKIADNCRQAQYLGFLLSKYEQSIKVIRPITLNIVNFRFESDELKSRLTDEQIDQFNDEILADVQTSGRAIASTTRFHGRLYIRVCIVSHRAIEKDFEQFVDDLLEFYQQRREII